MLSTGGSRDGLLFGDENTSVTMEISGETEEVREVQSQVKLGCQVGLVLGDQEREIIVVERKLSIRDKTTNYTRIV